MLKNMLNKDGKIEISIIMINYNGLKYLKRTVPAILNLDFESYEFIVVDNGSVDGSIDFLKGIPGVNLIQHNKIGEKNSACNFAAKQARGSYILFLDNDVEIIDRQLIIKLLSIKSGILNLGSLGVAVINAGEKTTKEYGGFFGWYFINTRRSIKPDALRRKGLFKVGFSQGCIFLIEKRLWGIVGGYDESIPFGGDDNDLGIKLSLLGYDNYVFTESIQNHLGIIERSIPASLKNRTINLTYAHLATIVKDFCFFNMVSLVIVYGVYAFLKSIKQSIFKRSLNPAIGFWAGIILFLKKLPSTVKARKNIQKSRMVLKDTFLTIKPPKFN
jgi:GT2 family glycosyltransferase